MKRVLTGSFLAAAFAVGLSAQTTPPQTTPPSTPPSSPTSAAPMQERESSSKNVTVTGCLKAGDSADSFTLSDLKFGAAKGSGAVGTSGAAGAAAAPPAALASATTLTIKPSSGAKLAEHVGHQVEISGSVAESKAPSTPADPAAAPRPSASAAGPTIEARSVRMVSDKCSGQ
jgi:hypothetical protein